MRSAKQWIRWASPLWIHCKRSSLLVVLGLFASVHLLSAAPPEHNFAEMSLSSANCTSAAGANLEGTIESSESSVSMDVVLRDASNSMDQSNNSRCSLDKRKSGLRRFTQSGTTGPPSVPNNNITAA